MNKTWPSDFFFNRPDFIKRRLSDVIVSFPLNDVTPLIYFTKKEERLISVEKSTYGGFIINETTTDSKLTSTLDEATSWCKSNDITSITVKMFPDTYHQVAANESHRLLQKFGFNTLYNDVTQIIPVQNTPPAMNVHRRRRLKNCIASGYTFERLKLNSITEAYPLFVQSRNEKGYPLTMSLTDFQESFSQFPNDYLLFGVRDNGKLIATCVCVIVSREILYTFFIGDDVAYRKNSPVTQLISGVYDFAGSRQFSLIDLGISTDKGILNPGLHSFKKSLGAQDVSKKTYELKL